MTKEEMMDNVIRKYGFESEEAILFCGACEDKKKDRIIGMLYEITMRR